MQILCAYQVLDVTQHMHSSRILKRVINYQGGDDSDRLACHCKELSVLIKCCIKHIRDQMRL